MGEVLRRNVTDARWAARAARVDGSKEEPGVLHADWFVDPFDLVRSRNADPAGATVRETATEILTYCDAPSRDAERAPVWSRWFRFAERTATPLKRGPGRPNCGPG